MTMDRLSQSSSDSPNRDLKVLSIECLKGSSKAEEWTGDMLQTGDIVEELRIGDSPDALIRFKSPFKNGKTAVNKILQDSYKRKETSIRVRVRRGPHEFAELQACIVPNDSSGKKQYVLRSITDPNYVVGFFDRTEAECFQLQGTLFVHLFHPACFFCLFHLIFVTPDMLQDCVRLILSCLSVNAKKFPPVA